MLYSALIIFSALQELGGRAEIDMHHRSMTAPPLANNTDWAEKILRRRRWDTEHCEQLQQEQREQRTARQLVAVDAVMHSTGPISAADDQHFHTAAQCLTAMTDVSEALR